LLAGGTGPALPPDDLGLPHTFAGEDPLGDALVALRPLEERRNLGQFLTPRSIVVPMLAWVQERQPEQIVDVGCGSGRFAVAAASLMPSVPVVAVDIDPAATLLCRAVVRRLALPNVTVRCADYLSDDLGLAGVRTAFVGNPPYVRHHRLTPATKAWGAATAKSLGIPFSGLSGLHLYFFLATALRARPGDSGCFITSAEWLDVHYGRGLRELLLGRLGLQSVCLLDETSAAFADAMTSAAITCFKVGPRPTSVRVSMVREFHSADGGEEGRGLGRAELGERWGARIRGARSTPAASGLVRLGDLARVHRGVATGANRFFVMRPEEARQLGLAAFARPVVSAAQQIIDSAGSMAPADYDVLVLLPRDVDGLPEPRRQAARRFIERGEREGIPQRYLCRHRAPWWWLGEPRPAPIIASYMARRPPAFALNPQGLLILNIAHGIHPRQDLPRPRLEALAASLNQSACHFAGNGRRYQGGLEKFEPREMEDLRLPLTEMAGE
jgi:hypothetical protein